MKIESVLFDLDGTLLDTAPDLAGAANILRARHNLPALPVEEMRSAVGYGGAAILNAAFGMEESNPLYTQFLTDYLDIYHEHLADTTDFFPGMDEVLTTLDRKQITWGIVTNKPSRFTFELLTKLNLKDRPACILCGDTLSRRKPHPDQIIHALELMNKPAKSCLYVGDTLVDVQASKAAGAYSLVALYGYTDSKEDPRGWKADGYVAKPLDILTWLEAFQC